MDAHDTSRLTTVTAAVLAAISPAFAAEIDPARPVSEVSVGIGYANNDGRQFGQYNGINESGAYGLLDLDFVRRDDATGTWLRFFGRSLGLESRLSGKAYSKAVERFVAATSEKPGPGAAVAVPHDQRVHLPGVSAIGCAVSPRLCSEALQRTVLGACDFVTMPMRWLDLEPSEGQYAFAGTDKWIEWAVRAAKLPIVGGPLVEIRPSCMPEWLSIWENDYETFRELVYEHIQKVVVRYRRTVARWTVCGGLHINSNFKLAFEQIRDLTRVCVLLVRKLQPGAKVMVEIAQPWGEYHAQDRKSLPPLMYADALAQSGLPIDAIGLRLQMGQPVPGQSTRDLAAISALLDRYAAFEKPIALTAVGAPSASKASQPSDAATVESPAGWWRQGWSEFAQSDWLAAVAAIACGKSYVQSFCWQDLADPPDGSTAPEMPMGGLVNAGGSPKPAGTRLTQIHNALRAGKSFIPA